MLDCQWSSLAEDFDQTSFYAMLYLVMDTSALFLGRMRQRGQSPLEVVVKSSLAWWQLIQRDVIQNNKYFRIVPAKMDGWQLCVLAELQSMLICAPRHNTTTTYTQRKPCATRSCSFICAPRHDTTTLYNLSQSVCPKGMLLHQMCSYDR